MTTTIVARTARLETAHGVSRAKGLGTAAVLAVLFWTAVVAGLIWLT